MARYSAVRNKRRTSSEGSLTAAVQTITDPSRAFRGGIGVSSSDASWQDQAWAYMRQVGELAYYVGWRASAASQCRLVASEIDPNTGNPTGSTDNQKVNQIVQDIGGGPDGQTEMIQRMTTFLTVPGEGWVAMVVRDPSRERYPNGLAAVPRTAADPTEEWVTLSRQELSFKGGNRDLVLTLPDGVEHDFSPGVDILFRVWQSDPQVAKNAYSVVKSAFDALNEIVRSTASIDNASQSRLVGNGIVLVPEEMSLPRQDTPSAIPPSGEVPGTPALEPAQSQQLQDLLFEVGTTAVKDPRSLAALMPIVVTAPGDMIKNVQHLKFGTDVSETSLKTRDKAMERLARSLEVAPERLLGMGSNSNHWTAWAIGDDDIKVHISPPVEKICAALTRAVLRQKLIEIGIDPDEYVVWYDTTDLTQDPDKKDEAQEAFDRGAVNSGALRRELGFSDEDGYDLSTAGGWLQLAMDRCSQDPSLIPMFSPILGTLVEGIAAPAQPAAIEQAPEDEEDDADAGAEPESDEEPPSDEDSSVTAGAFLRVCVARAMELANKRRRTRANHHLFDGELALDQAHIRLEPASDVSRLIEGWDSVLYDRDVRAFGLHRARLRAVVLAITTDALGTSRAWQVTPEHIQQAMH